VIVAFTPEHLKADYPPGLARQIAENPTEDLVRALRRVGTIAAPTGEVLGVMGAVDKAPGVCEVFILATRAKKRFPHTFAKEVRRELHKLREDFVKIVAVADDTFVSARFFTWLRFWCVGEAPNGLNGERRMAWEISGKIGGWP